jgi:hypothetical protein
MLTPKTRPRPADGTVFTWHLGLRLSVQSITPPQGATNRRLRISVLNSTADKMIIEPKIRVLVASETVSSGPPRPRRHGKDAPD